MPTMNLAIPRLMRRYGIPVILLLLGYAAWAGALAHTFFFIFAVIAGPAAALWIFWLIAREPPVERFSQKGMRLAAVLLFLAPPLTLAIASVDVFRTDTTGLGMFIAAFVFAPWTAIQIVPGVIVLLRVAFQRLAPAEMASAPTSAG